MIHDDGQQAPLSNDALEARWRRAGTRVLPVCEERVFIHRSGDESPSLLAPLRDDVSEMLAHADSPIWVCADGGIDYFAVRLRRHQPRQRIPGGDFEDLRSVAGLLNDGDWSLLARAKAMVQWHDSHEFCARCGAPTGRSPGGQSRYCSNPECGQQHFPRTDPAVIVRIRHGDQILLGRQPSWPKRRRSVLAGFVAPGEAAEQAVSREVYEEAGLQVDRGSIGYFGSQPWPFPGSLMLAYTAHSKDTGIQRLDGELADAEWWQADDLRQAVAEKHILLPTPRSIARALIEDWMSTA